MGMLRSVVVLLLIIVGLTNMSCLNAVPSTRSKALMQGNSASMAGNIKDDEEYKEEKRRELEVELEDYPGSGANNRHTPRPQFGRGCLDC